MGTSFPTPLHDNVDLLVPSPTRGFNDVRSRGVTSQPHGARTSRDRRWLAWKRRDSSAESSLEGYVWITPPG